MSEADKIIKSLRDSGKKVEEFYMSNKTSDKNVANIEIVIKDCREHLKIYGEAFITASELDRIENVLAEREQKDERIKELEEELEKANRQLDLDYVEENFIPKQKVMDKIEELIIDNRYYDKFLESRDIQYTIDILREILEGGK